MESLQTNKHSSADSQEYLFDELNQQEPVSGFLAECFLSQYLPVFMEEGFDSIESVCFYMLGRERKESHHLFIS
jgi:hypothetical protein